MEEERLQNSVLRSEIWQQHESIGNIVWRSEGDNFSQGMKVLSFFFFLLYFYCKIEPEDRIEFALQQTAKAMMVVSPEKRESDVMYYNCAVYLCG